MKSIINGKMYDTETAVELCVKVHTISLFRKKCGEYFIYDYDNRYGEKIFTVEEEFARMFVEKNDTSDTYEEIFGEVTE